jgi:pyruvate/2-oxoglutarate dehydrogenase complex dihydrolipoamide dehydrogenase (E3) component/uncharacterized membrane protein YdjX (TVP38/TMEM64 family)
MKRPYDYDVVVIGAGSGGLVASKLIHGLRRKTALIEKRRIGGDCTWFGCVPSKTLIKSAHIAHDLTRLREFGLEPAHEIAVDASQVMAHVRQVVEADAAGHTGQDIEAEGIDMVFGPARFLDAHRIQVGDRIISAKRFIIATGSHPLVPDIEGLAEIPYLTNESVFSLKELPQSLIVIGGGPIGIELASALNRLQVDVTVLQRAAHILERDDRDLTDRLLKTLEDEGVKILLETMAMGFSQTDQGILVEVQGPEGPKQIAAESVLVAAGREPNLDDLGLHAAGVSYNKQGIRVDTHLRSTAKNIYACGDVVAPLRFTHMAEYEAVIAGTNAALGLPLRKTNYTHVAWSTYTDPELAHAGLTEQEARAQYGDSIRIYRWEHQHVDRAKTDLNTNGLSKFIVDKRGKLLGIHILGHGATELMHEAQFAKSLGLRFSKIASVIHAYPSYSDAVRQPAKRALIDGLQQKMKLAKLAGKVAAILLIVMVLALIMGALPIKAWFIAGLEWTDGLGAWGPLFVGLFYVLACVLFIPGSVLTLGAGFLFKAVLGTITVSIGATAGACAAFLVGRTVARQWIARKIEGNRKFAAIDEAVGQEGFKIVLLTRLSPVFPFNLLNYAFGLTQVPFWKYALASWIGMLPGTIMYVYFGTGLRSLADAAAGVETGRTGQVFMVIGLALAIAVAVIVTQVARRALDRAMKDNPDSAKLAVSAPE